MPATIVQPWTFAAAVGSPTTTSVNLPSGAAVAGNTILVAVNCDNVVNTPSGYTKLGESVHNAGCYLFGKVAAGGETGVTVTPAAGAPTVVGIEEIGGLVGATILDRLDQIVSNGTSSGVSARSTGTTGTTSQADEYAVAIIGPSISQVGKPNGGGNNVSGFSNSFTEVSGGDVATANASGNNVGLIVATRNLSATGAIETTGTYELPLVFSTEALMATFKVAAGSTLNADAALAVTATETATATVTRPADAALTVASTRAATATVDRNADATLTATATLAATATVTRNADAALVVTAIRTSLAVVNILADAALAVTATLIATAATPNGEVDDAPNVGYRRDPAVGYRRDDILAFKR